MSVRLYCATASRVAESLRVGGGGARGQQAEAGRLAEGRLAVQPVGVVLEVGGEPLVWAEGGGEAVPQPGARLGEARGRRPVQPPPRGSGDHLVHGGADHRVGDADPRDDRRSVEAPQSLVAQHGDGRFAVAHTADGGRGQEVGPGVTEHGEGAQQLGRVRREGRDAGVHGRRQVGGRGQRAARGHHRELVRRVLLQERAHVQRASAGVDAELLGQRGGRGGVERGDERGRGRAIQPVEA